MNRKKQSESNIKQRMAQSVTQTSASLVPPGIGNQPDESKPEPEVKVIPIADLIDDAEAISALEQLAKLYKEQSTIEGIAKKQKENAGARIKDTFKLYGIKAASVMHYTVTVSLSSRSYINPMKLLALGVAQATIDAATDKTDSPTIRVTERKK